VPDPETYRLPRNAAPSRYQLEIRPDLERASFTGRVTVEVDVLEPSERLVLHAVDLELSRVDLITPDGTGTDLEVGYIEAEQMVTLTPPRPLDPGRHILTIEYTGGLNDQLRGFYLSTFTDDAGDGRVIATTQFEAADARRACPCWDEPDFKAVFAITLVVAPGLTAISNAAVETTRTLDDGQVEWRFADTIVMSTYLVAFIVGPYELTPPDVVDGIPMSVATVPGKLGLTGFATEAARHSLTFLARYFGIPYPGSKLDHVAVPDFAFGAMENLGCVTYRESQLLADGQTASGTELQRVAIVIAHETAHMWFGDLVTMRWWNGIWLNEAFATFMELTTADDFRPDWDVWAAFASGKSAALETDGLMATRPVEYPVGRPEEADGMFDVLTYEKGGAVLKMLEQYLEPEVFRKGISHYLTTHAYGNTDAPDLWAALEEVSGEPVGTIMESWIHQGGYPIVHASIGDDPATVTLRQERFTYSGSDPRRWAVPLRVRASAGGVIRHERLLLEEESGSISFDAPIDWIAVNDGSWGFYRVSYSPDLRSRLLAAGLDRVLSSTERLELLRDAWAAVVAGRSPLAEWADTASAVVGGAGPDPDLWAAVGATLDELERAGDDDDRAAVAAWARRLATPAWAEAGWQPTPGETERAGIARGRILRVLAGVGGDAGLAEATRPKLAAHLRDPDGGHLAPDLITAAAHITVATGGEDGWATVLEAYRTAAQPQEKQRFLYALAETPVPDLRARTLDMCLEADVRSQDAAFVVAYVLRQPGAGPAAWDWLESNWSRFAERIPPSLVVYALDGTTALVDPDLAGRVRRFLRSTELPLAAVRIDQILERMDVNVALASRLRTTMPSALTEPVGGSRR
jgi:puromycin-sensitive aminopeptidase